MNTPTKDQIAEAYESHQQVMQDVYAHNENIVKKAGITLDDI